MLVTLDIPEELAAQLGPLEAHLPKILELGLRELNASAQAGFEGAAEVLEFLAKLPTPEEIIDLHPSEALQTQVSALLEKNRTEGLTSSEERQWQRYQYLEHLVRIAKAEAYAKLKAS
jgi:hypothetical protein